MRHLPILFLLTANRWWNGNLNIALLCEWCISQIQIKINEQWVSVEYNEAIKIESWRGRLYNIHARTIVNVILQLKYWPFYPQHPLLYDKIVNTKLLLPSMLPATIGGRKYHWLIIIQQKHLNEAHCLQNKWELLHINHKCHKTDYFWHTYNKNNYTSGVHS